ncbi:MAG: MOSC domain-containing protein [Actinomycetota bacterium]|nr:MOSC domain-containing protein [Actinomycetota bacterium]
MGQVEAIFISAEQGELPLAVGSVRAVAGKGLEGNRYFDEGKPETELTLIEAEALEALRAEHGIELDGASSRRNVLTRGVRLNDLVGKRFRVGQLECRGIELCEPCSHLESMTQPGVIKGLVHRGGLNAEILVGGDLRPGDEIEPV